jgi:hypothetical protein
MNTDQFWQLNENLPSETAALVIEERLAKLDPAEIISYQAHFSAAFIQAYQWKLWGAAYIIDGGCSDDGFIDFRYGLIARGRGVFEAALLDPDSLVNIADDSDEGYIPNEDFGYVARQVYEKKTGKEMPSIETIHPLNPSDDDWDFDDEELNAQKLPKLWAKFGG